MSQLISIFTPCHNINFLRRAYDSLREQTYQNWEWVVYLNGNVKTNNVTFHDDRVKFFRGDVTGSCGAVKAECTKQCTGEWVVELDHDDELTPNCLEEIVKANADFFYSDCAHSRDIEGKGLRYNPFFGWDYKTYDWKGKTLDVPISPGIHPANLALIFFAPDHVRAYRKSYYNKIGGHNPEIQLGDDHDLVIRAYLGGGKIVQSHDVLYIYHMHDKNTCQVRNPEVQQQTWKNYHNYIWPMIEKWATDKKLRKIDLGGGINKVAGYESYDLYNGDIIGNLNETWNLPDNSVGVLRAHDILEHLTDPIHAMNEAYRVLAPNGFFMISVPCALGQGAYCDPTHKSFWVQRSFRYYTEPQMQKFLHGCNCKFQPTFINNITKWEDKIPYVDAHLVAWKDSAGHPHGGSHWRQI